MSNPTLQKTESGDGWLMLGTNKGYDYIVAARNGDFAIGIRPLFAISDAACGFAFRVRAMYAPTPKESGSEDVTEVNFGGPKGPEAAQAILEAFPGFTFQRVDENRASFIGEFPSMAVGVYQIDKIASWFDEKDIPSRIIETIKAGLGDGAELVDRAVVKNYLRGFYTEAFDKIKKKMDPEPQPEAMPDNPVVSIEDWKAKHSDDEMDAHSEDLDDEAGEE